MAHTFKEHMKILHTKAVIEKANIVEAGIVDNVIGSSSVFDRMGDSIDQNGWILNDFKKNPVILWAHNQGLSEERPPIGKALKVWIENKGKNTARLMFKIQFDLQDSFAAEIYRKIKDQFLNTVSVGFQPHEWEELDPDNWFGGLKYTKQSLLELSIVPVPANPEALIQLNSFAQTDKRFTPMDLKQFTHKIPTIDLIRELEQKPYENEHSCRLKNPDDFQDDSFKRMKREHEGKEYSVIMGKLDGEDTMTDQAFRYDKNVWDEGSAKTHCQDHTGTFEPAKKENPKEETKEETKEVEEAIESKEEEKSGQIEEKKEAIIVTEKAGRVISTKNEKKLRQADSLLNEVLAELEEEPEEDPNSSTPPKEEGKEQKEAVSKNIIVYKDQGKEPESEAWDSPGEVAKATIEDLKEMSAWVNIEKAEDKSSYKLIHHKAEGHKAVWRGVATAMASLLGAKGGVDIQDSDRKGVYDHLVEHYKEFGKNPPEFKLVEEQVLAGLNEEILSLSLDREEKHVVRLIKKVLDYQKENQKTISSIVNNKPIDKSVEALKLLNLALTKVSKQKGGE